MKKMSIIKRVSITGGAGYVGAVLVPKLLREGYEVSVLDLYLYGDVLAGPRCEFGNKLKEYKGDLRDPNSVREFLKGSDAVIHLACISNDPSFELNPNLGKSINYDAFLPLVRASKEAGIQRFVYASSSSVYGVKEEAEVTEELSLEPLTDYSKFKAMCEDQLLQEAGGMTSLVLRPATVCGYSPRLRLDLTVNILTNFAVNKGEITVFGGGQQRPNLHIEDMTDLYIQSLRYPAEKIDKKIFNAGYENHTVAQIAEMVQMEVGKHISIKRVPTDDNRSYRVSSKKIALELGFKPVHTILEAIRDLKHAFEKGLIPNSFTDSRYFNIKRMQEVSFQ